MCSEIATYVQWRSAQTQGDQNFLILGNFSQLLNFWATFGQLWGNFWATFGQLLGDLHRSRVTRIFAFWAIVFFGQLFPTFEVTFLIRVGFISGDFFANSFGRPAQEVRHRNRLSFRAKKNLARNVFLYECRIANVSLNM
jgi:hypothetical protein